MIAVLLERTARIEAAVFAASELQALTGEFMAGLASEALRIKINGVPKEKYLEFFEAHRARIEAEILSAINDDGSVFDAVDNEADTAGLIH